MKRIGRGRLLELEEEDAGFCLKCGTEQEYVEPRLYLGLCGECNWQSVIPAETVREALEWVAVDWEGEGEG